MIKMAVLGYGTVGSGVVEVIEKNKDEISIKANAELSIKYILDIRKFPGDPYEDKITSDFELILNDPEIQIICETMGGINPAYDFTKRALLSGKSVCTSNKELVADHGPELISIASEKKCNYLFEASVGGGIPIIRPLNYSLTAEKIDEITGILNGTTNFILSKMEKEGADFFEALKEAQASGYAEQNPAADIEGHDTCRKLAILSSLMTTKNVNYKEIYTEGIKRITKDDFAYANSLNQTIKLLAISKYDEDNNFYACVAPFMISKEHPLYFVNGTFNGIYVHGNMLGYSMYYGKGAGKLPTASAVVADVIDCARHLGKTVMCFWDKENITVAPFSKRSGQFFVRIIDTPENKEKAEELFPDMTLVSPMRDGEIAFITAHLTEASFAEKEKLLDGKIISRIRIAL
ncbi:MAG: homoserine dehydrogenase [Lachnospiraceae bacterium]|nr:homoserine dehydrogenase [Lachnospiraceae bacterium]